MTYFKLSSWKISTWLPLGRERRGRPCELRLPKTRPKPCFKRGFKLAANLLATALAQSTRSG